MSMRLTVALTMGFLAPGAPAAAASAQVRLLSGDSPLCASMRVELQAQPDKFREEASDALGWQARWQDADVLIPDWQHAGAIAAAQFDFDNDGHGDQVIIYSYHGSYMKGSVLMVIRGEIAAGHRADPTGPDARHWFLPCQWDPHGLSISQCPGYSQDHDEAGFTMPAGKSPAVKFRARYTKLTPIRRSQRSYVVATGMDSASRNHVAIIEPLPDKAYEKRCLLRLPKARQSAKKRI